MLGALLFARHGARKAWRPARVGIAVSKGAGDGAAALRLWQVVDLCEGFADLIQAAPAVALTTVRKVGAELRARLSPAELGELARACAARRVSRG